MISHCFDCSTYSSLSIEGRCVECAAARKIYMTSPHRHSYTWDVWLAVFRAGVGWVRGQIESKQGLSEREPQKRPEGPLPPGSIAEVFSGRLHEAIGQSVKTTSGRVGTILRRYTDKTVFLEGDEGWWFEVSWQQPIKGTYDKLWHYSIEYDEHLYLL